MDLTKYSKGKRMVREDLIKEIGENKADLEEIKVVLPKKVNSCIVENITSISGEILSNLKAGDVILKKTGEQYHSYRVSFKKDDEGICLTYTDASVVETVSYDLVGTTWTYNSTDVTPLGVVSTMYNHNITINCPSLGISGLQFLVVSARETAYTTIRAINNQKLVVPIFATGEYSIDSNTYRITGIGMVSSSITIHYINNGSISISTPLGTTGLQDFSLSDTPLPA